MLCFQKSQLIYVDVLSLELFQHFREVLYVVVFISR